tara:strand:- start:159 stop:1187 length:1029 start_codon:yes stop_codon:yes gene_type:complete
MKTLNVGIAGFGVVGRRRKKCLDNNASANVVAVCDKDLMETSKSGSTKYFKDHNDLLNENLDVLIVCLPNDIAPHVTIKGLKKGLHVFCEKPPGRTVQDILDVIKIEKLSPKLKLKYGFNHRYHLSIQDAETIIKSNKLGKIINMRGVYGKSQLITFNQPAWRTKREIAGGGVLLDQGIHMIDLMRLFGGNFTEVFSHVSNSHWGHDVEDNAYALMKTDEGVVAMLHSSATQWRHRFNLEINLQRGNIILGGILSGSKSYGEETLTVVTADPNNDAGNPIEQTTKYNKDPSWESEINSFINSIINNTSIKSGTSQDALESMKLVNQIYCNDPAWKAKFNIES